MCERGLAGIYRRRRNGCTVRDPAATPSSDLINRRFVADRPDALWVTDVTQHRSDEGWVYCAVVLDFFAATLNNRPRKTLGWKTPAEAMNEQLLCLQSSDVATTD
jgi:putative transposase